MNTRGTKAAVARRVDVVYRLLLLGLDRARIIEHVEKKHPGWGCGAAAIDRYIARAKQLLIEAGEQEREMEFGRARARLHDIFARCLNDKDYSGALAVQREINKLFGLYPEKKVSLTVQDLTLSDIDEEIARLEAALAASPDST